MASKRVLDAHVIWRRSGPSIVFPFPKTHGTFIDDERRREVLLRHAGKRTRSAQLPTGDEISASIYQRLHSAIYRLLPNGSVRTGRQRGQPCDATIDRARHEAAGGRLQHQIVAVDPELDAGGAIAWPAERYGCGAPRKI